MEFPNQDSDWVYGAKTARARNEPSLPVQYLYGHQQFAFPILDYGCGRGTDVDWLRKATERVDVYGWDPKWSPGFLPKRDWRTILCTYVLNVVPEEVGFQILARIEQLLTPGGIALISVRNDDPDTWGPSQRVVTLDLPVKVVKPGRFVTYFLRKPYGSLHS